MMEVLRCPQCSSELPAASLDGLCPKCLLRAAITPAEEETATNDAFEQTMVSQPPAQPASPAPANKMFGDYELLEEIARGGMGVVYRARQTGLDRIVALKMILSGGLASEAEIERFQIEAQAAANLDHPGIVPVFDVGRVDDRHYFSMAFVSGESLADRLERGPIPDREAARLIRDVAAAVQYAHARGVIHRDLKPANILMDESGPRITDFGLAKRTDNETQLTVTGQAMGTPSYMPPEQAAGKEAMNLPTADVYALGAILYALLTGRPPFKADSLLDTLKQVLEREPDAPRDMNGNIHADLETICLKCLEKRPDARYGSAEELVDELNRFLDGQPIDARPLSPLGRVLRWRRIVQRNADVRIRSATEILGAPLVDIAFGHDDAKGETSGHARGIFAFGDMATGVFACGGVARGVIAYGKHSFGVIGLGLTSCCVFPMGLVSFGLVSFGGLSIGGVFAMGMIAIGWQAIGMVALGPNAMGGWIWP